MRFQGQALASASTGAQMINLRFGSVVIAHTFLTADDPMLLGRDTGCEHGQVVDQYRKRINFRQGALSGIDLPIIIDLPTQLLDSLKLRLAYGCAMVSVVSYWTHYAGMHFMTPDVRIGFEALRK